MDYTHIILGIGLLGIIVCLLFIVFVLRKLISSPIKMAKEQAKQATEVEVQRAKIQIANYKAETRLEPKRSTLSTSIGDLDQLKSLRRKK